MADGKASRDQYFALFDFTYDDRVGRLVRGQVIELAGHVNDQKLVNLRYLGPCHPGTPIEKCDQCDAWFMDEAARHRHMQLVHHYVCACGWEPAPDVKDKARSLSRHQARCEHWQSLKDRDRTEHVKLVSAAG